MFGSFECQMQFCCWFLRVVVWGSTNFFYFPSNYFFAASFCLGRSFFDWIYLFKVICCVYLKAYQNVKSHPHPDPHPHPHPPPHPHTPVCRHADARTLSRPPTHPFLFPRSLQAPRRPSADKEEEEKDKKKKSKSKVVPLLRKWKGSCLAAMEKLLGGLTCINFWFLYCAPAQFCDYLILFKNPALKPTPLTLWFRGDTLFRVPRHLTMSGPRQQAQFGIFRPVEDVKKVQVPGFWEMCFFPKWGPHFGSFCFCSHDCVPRWC